MTNGCARNSRLDNYEDYFLDPLTKTAYLNPNSSTIYSLILPKSKDSSFNASQIGFALINNKKFDFVNLEELGKYMTITRNDTQIEIRTNYQKSEINGNYQLQ
jgi:hypothetical protein